MNRYEEDTGTQFVVENPCERCREPMPEEWLGFCWECRAEIVLEERAELAAERVLRECICSNGLNGMPDGRGFNGRSVCGVPCPVHGVVERNANRSA